jgi:hydrogenase nickel incorporation protein HypA/HybF
MHELAICQALVDQVSGIVQRRGAQSVTSIRIRVGPLSGVVPGLLMSAFPLASAGSAAEGAELDIHEAPVRVHCQTCGAQTDATPNRLLCGACGDWHTQLVAGDELTLESVELRTEGAFPHV